MDGQVCVIGIKREDSSDKVYGWVGPNGRSGMRNRLSAIRYKERGV